MCRKFTKVITSVWDILYVPGIPRQHNWFKALPFMTVGLLYYLKRKVPSLPGQLGELLQRFLHSLCTNL